MATYYIGADLHCNNTELAIESRGKVVRHYSVPTTIRVIGGVIFTWPYKILTARIFDKQQVQF